MSSKHGRFLEMLGLSLVQAKRGDRVMVVLSGGHRRLAAEEVLTALDPEWRTYPLTLWQTEPEPQDAPATFAWSQERRVCATCNGSAWIPAGGPGDMKCPRCKGRGYEA